MKLLKFFLIITLIAVFINFIKKADTEAETANEAATQSDVIEATELEAKQLFVYKGDTCFMLNESFYTPVTIENNTVTGNGVGKNIIELEGEKVKRIYL